MYKASRKFVTVDPTNSKAVGICDYSGFYFNHDDLQRQMEWRGNALVWTGYLVGKPFLDTPNEVMRPITPYADPVPVAMARPPQGAMLQPDGTFNPNALNELENAHFMTSGPS